MGRTSFLLQRFREEDFDSYLEELLSFDLIEGDAAIGIAKKVISEGFNSLSEAQQHVFLHYVIEPNYYDDCKRCVTKIPWSEMIVAGENDGFCSYCQHMMEKDD